MPASHAPASSDLSGLETIEWVFGYGSLMWNPGFPFVHSTPATLHGFHRSFCIYSHHYRGTAERPGLVLGLDGGGACRGVAFKIRQHEREDVITYLNERELIGYAYIPKVVEVEVGAGAANGTNTVRAYTFIADHKHSQYAGQLCPEKMAELIMSAEGHNGLNRDYLMNTVHQLEAQGFRDDDLHDLFIRVQHLTRDWWIKAAGFSTVGHGPLRPQIFTTSG